MARAYILDDIVLVRRIQFRFGLPLIADMDSMGT